MTLSVALPVVYEAKRTNSRVKTYGEEFDFEIPEADQAEVLMFRRTGLMPLRYAMHQGKLHCPLRGASQPDTPPSDAARILWMEFKESKGITGTGPGTKATDALHVGRRADGSFYPCVAPTIIKMSRKVPDGDDRARRVVDLMAEMPQALVVIRGSLWRRCEPPLLTFTSPLPERGTNQLLGLAYGASLEGLPANGVACVWSVGAHEVFKDFRRLAGPLAMQRRADTGPATPPDIEEDVAPLQFDTGRANAAAIGALVRSRMGDFLPYMETAGFRAWLAVREAESLHVASPSPGNAAAFYEALGRLAAVAHVGDDAPSEGSRMRWETLKLALRVSVLRHFAEDRGLAPGEAFTQARAICAW